ncbi:death-associated protein kinase related-like [Drosophila miranda]|uniref:death-associated protein kinase related-like n=1 Tax=Drosophila miranda TaxID=7229 RepID=UPI00143FB271|nr:death-associated protein kinase related-like [Drosophila miranda]
MFTEKGIFPIGDGLLDVDAERFNGLLVSHDINEIYEVEQTPFARGKFAAVRRAIHKNTGSHFAAKFLKRRRRAQSSDKEIKHEIAVLILCEGEENIVNLNAVHETRSDTALLLELATGGELQTILDNEECLTEAQARHCMREVLKALKFLHDRSIAHLDLKPQNILLASERIEDGLKLCDFGISRVVCECINVREMAGTPDYVAPEVLQYEPLSLLTDIWSVGVLTYVLLSGFSPFGGNTKQETFLNINGSSSSISKIPIATGKLLGSPISSTSTSTETTTAIHTLTSNGHGQSNTVCLSAKPTQIATIQLGSNGLDEFATVVATLTLFPDAPTTPKVIRKAPTGESHGSATSVKALVKKFQLEETLGRKRRPLSDDAAA